MCGRQKKSGVARALESKLEERMLIDCRAELGWAKADDTNISLLNGVIELRLEKGERVLRFELDPKTCANCVTRRGP